MSKSPAPVLWIVVAAAMFAASAVAARVMPSVEAISRPGLRLELMEMVEQDQIMRRAQPRDQQRILAVDRRNTARLRQLVDELGWPTVQMIGTDGVVAAFLIVQHADQDRAFQLKVLEVMKELVASGRAPSDQYAYLHDRTHTPQRYGTQGSCGASGKWEPRELENASAVDKFRSEVRMAPLAEIDGEIAALSGPGRRVSPLQSIEVRKARYYMSTPGVAESGLLDVYIRNATGGTPEALGTAGATQSACSRANGHGGRNSPGTARSYSRRETRHIQMQPSMYGGICGPAEVQGRAEVNIALQVEAAVSEDGQKISRKDLTPEQREYDALIKRRAELRAALGVE